MGYASVYPPAFNDTYVKATTSTTGDGGHPYTVCDPSKALTGDNQLRSWESLWAHGTNQRFHIDLGVAAIIKRIYYHNYHISGGYTNRGGKNFTLQGSNTAGAFAELTYATNTNWTGLTTSPTAFDQHVDADSADPKYVVVTNDTPYRYYAIKIADSWGEANLIGLRRIELQILTDARRREAFLDF